MRKVQSSNATDRDEDALDPAAAAIVAKVRRLSLIASLTAVIGIGAVVGIIGYRVFRAGESAAPQTAPAATLTLPAGATVVGTAIGDGTLAVTVDLGNGRREIRLFTLGSLKPAGTLAVGPRP